MAVKVGPFQGSRVWAGWARSPFAVNDPTIVHAFRPCYGLLAYIRVPIPVRDPRGMNLRLDASAGYAQGGFLLPHKYAWLASRCCTFTSNRGPLIAVGPRLSRQGDGTTKQCAQLELTHHSRLASSDESFPDEVCDSHLLKGWQRSATHGTYRHTVSSFVSEGLAFDALLAPIAVVVQDFDAALNVATRRLRRGRRALDCFFLREAGKVRNTVRWSCSSQVSQLRTLTCALCKTRSMSRHGAS